MAIKIQDWKYLSQFVSEQAANISSAQRKDANWKRIDYGKFVTT
jgi:hypothetical protein